MMTITGELRSAYQSTVLYRYHHNKYGTVPPLRTDGWWIVLSSELDGELNKNTILPITKTSCHINEESLDDSK